ncbi:MAG TPA: outer membrane beta-barrel protein, partial [Polyangiaceae bacterium]
MRLRSNLFAFTAAATLQMSSSNALAQAAPTPPPAQPAPGGAQPPEPPGGAQTPPSPQPAPPPPAPATAPAAPEPPAEPAAPVAPSVQPTPAPLSEEAPATEAPARKNWREAIQFRVFADAYAGVNYNFPKPQRGPQDEVRAYDTANGFALSWVGADVSHPADPVGGTIGLRWGPTAERYAGCFSLVDPCDNQVGLQFVKQAFGSWKPGGKDSGFRLDLGKFDTIYGVEVAESQDNINYTRGLLYWLGHPLFHTGIRAVWDVNRSFEINALLVNGYNNTIDNNAGKTAGFQFKLRVPRDEKTEDDTLSAAIGYLVGPERDDTVEVQCADGFRFDPGVGCVADPTKKAATYRADQKNSDTQGLRHLIDLVVSARPADGVELVANADL